MVYVDRDGRVNEGNRVSWRRPVDSFLAILSIFVLFIVSLFSPLTRLVNPSFGSTSSNFRSGGSSRGNNNNDRRGGFRTMSDIRPPPMPFGGCSGGSCG